MAMDCGAQGCAPVKEGNHACGWLTSLIASGTLTRLRSNDTYSYVRQKQRAKGGHTTTSWQQLI